MLTLRENIIKTVTFAIIVINYAFNFLHHGETLWDLEQLN